MHPWPDRPVCLLDVPDDPGAVGWLTYLPPDGTRRTSLPVTRGPTRDRTPDFPHPVWHVETPEPGVAVTTPSIMVSTTRPDPPPDGPMRDVVLYHSPARVVWDVVEELPDGE